MLLVQPTSTSSTASNFTFVTGHGGGIVWYANYLYVTDTAGGIRVFDINKLAKVDTYGSGVSTYGISGGRSSACASYVLPQRP
ncbi:Secreted protein OS=Streptomyces glaucescens OX=1907 GN=SGLAU_09645 PE=4 SV=1 [Streptomyces glaucescens]